MWRHYCPAEHLLISVATGERCNWCNQQQPMEVEAHRPTLLQARTAEML